MDAVLRQATRHDIAGMHKVRMTVQENRLVSTTLAESDYIRAIEITGRGFGRQLHDQMVSWLWQQGLQRLWLSTDPGTRAQRFYQAAGWQHVGAADHGEVRLELVHR